MNTKLLNYIEQSFMYPLLKDENITDISYNGKDIFYMHNIEGRCKSTIQIKSDDINDFIRQIANLAEKQFSYSNPILDTSVGKFRLNATHNSICRVHDDKAISFSLRIGSEETKIKNDGKFMPKSVDQYLLKCLEKGNSIIIAGATGTGKTELQKYLLTQMKDNTRIIVIDDVQELTTLNYQNNLDITFWQIPSMNANTSINELVRNALRCNPDWLIVSESRGKEMSEILNSVMTGHPIITTLHSKTLSGIPNRIVRMIQMSNENEKQEVLLNDVLENLTVYVYLKKKILDNGNVERFVDSVAEVQEDKSLKIIYKRK